MNHTHRRLAAQMGLVLLGGCVAQLAPVSPAAVSSCGGVESVALGQRVEEYIRTGTVPLDNVRAVLVVVDGHTKLTYYRHGFTAPARTMGCRSHNARPGRRQRRALVVARVRGRLRGPGLRRTADRGHPREVGRDRHPLRHPTRTTTRWTKSTTSSKPSSAPPGLTPKACLQQGRTVPGSSGPTGIAGNHWFIRDTSGTCSSSYSQAREGPAMTQSSARFAG